MSDTSCLLAQATNPEQYDKISWSEIEASLQSKNGTRKFFFDVFDKKVWKNQKVLDLGCGTGWLVKEIEKAGAKRVIGIDPSIKNITIGKHLFPKSKIYQHNIESFPVKEKFDIVVSSMVFCHISNVELALQKLYHMLTKTGRLQIIVPGYEYFKSKSKITSFESVELTAEEYVVKTERREGSMCDIVRTVSWYLKKMEQNEFQITLVKSITSSKKLLFGAKRFKNSYEPVAYYIEVKK
jgi:2-polyprenyl-3-methyl-5-hydroxy-6-metoxy-1,4-benzoquinol methylase